MNIHQISKNDSRGANWIKQSAEFYRARSKEEIETDDEYVFYLSQPCPHYKMNEEGFACTIYETRPTICKRFPHGWNKWMEAKCKVMEEKYKL